MLFRSGKTPADASGGSADKNKPYPVDTLDRAVELFASRTGKVVNETPLYSALRMALLQDPKPSKIYGVRVDADNYAAALSSLEAADDVTFVSLASETNVARLAALKTHVEDMSAQGQKRVGVAMADPAKAKSVNYVAEVKAATASLQSDSGRMVVVAARGAVTDAATAAMAAIAGFEPHISMVLKKVREIKATVKIGGQDVLVNIPPESQFSPSEIKGLSELGLIPLIHPSLIVGESTHFADGQTYSSDASVGYIDIVRVLDDIDFRLKAGLIGSIGDARITKAGMLQLKTQVDGILGPLKRRAVIDNFALDIPVFNVLALPESTWTATDKSIVTTARATRSVDMFLSVTYGPAVHRLKVTLAPTF